ncbi:hypothetical protein C804_03085 [Lachnospiraceae bacterium A4]|nr:hypothetical protein C804_03085 [Lachnospiraceae bacterium A4]
MYSRANRAAALALAGMLAAGSVSDGINPVHTVQAAEQTKEVAVDAAVQEHTDEIKEEIKYERIDISTPEEFAAFASQCYIDAWSKNKYVSLRADIDLSGTQIKLVPVFNGVFDGVGHTISGFDYMGDGYVVGLFRYVGRDGLIQNLTVKGAVASENEKECMGSICGINHGTIKNCTFQGTVSGRDTIGGIAGINEGTGTIAGCAVKGRITGYYSTGGIVGINHGALNNCTNRAGINDNSEWVEQDDEMGTGMGILESLTTHDDNELYSGVDTGGIAGFSDGVISRCANSGTVGYEHTGYNIGGIAGRQSGVVSLCTNSGTVYGRKDIGGIVGQMEPFIEIDEAESLRNAINKLHDIIEKTIDDMDAASDGVKGDVDKMQSYADSTIDSGDVLVTQITDFVDENVDEVNTVSARMEHIIDMLPDVLNHVSAAGDRMSDLNDTAKQLSEDLAILDKLDDNVYDETDYSRLSLLSTVGGTLTADSTNPQEKDTVTITVTPNDGYKLKEGSLTVKDAGGKKLAATPVSGRSDQYTFTMPKKNVKVMAQFIYEGTFLVKSTVGGRVTTARDNDKVTFKAAASGGYRFDGFKVDGSAYTGPVSADNEITLDKKTYIKEGTATMVEAVFTKTATASHKITVKSGTGGTAYVAGGGNTAAAGEEVTIHIVAAPEYVFQEMRVTGDIASTPSSSNVNERVFKMPDNDATVEVLFQNKYDKAAKNRIYPESNAGGVISVHKGASGTQYQITIKPDENYDVDENKALEFKKVTLSGAVRQDSGAQSASGETADSQAQPNSERTAGGDSTTDTQNPSDDTTGSDNTIAPQNPSDGTTESGSTADTEKPSNETTESDSTADTEKPSDNSTESDSAVNTENPSVETTESDSAPQIPSENESETQTERTDEDSSENETNNTPESAQPEETLPWEEENPENANAISAAVLGKSELVYDSENKTYTYIVDLADDVDSYSAYATFVKTQKDTAQEGESYNVITASSTGGVVAVDTTSAKEGEKVYATPSSNNGYILTSILVNGAKPALESDGKRYSFTMPSKDAEVTAQFEPVDLILKSNMSGNATYSGSAEGKVTVSVKPSAAYAVKSITVTDAGGKKLSVSKRQSGAYIYEFDLAKMSKAPCTVEIKFNKQNKKQAVDTSKNNIKDSVEELSKSSEAVQKSINTIKNIVQKPDGSYKSWDELTQAEQDTIITEVIQLVENLGEMSSSAASILSSLSTVYNILSPYATDAAEAARKDIDKATEHIHGMLDSLKAANNSVRGIVNYMNAQPDLRFSKLGDDFDRAKENFHDQLKGLSDSIKALSDNAAGYSDIINDDLRAVNDQLNVVFNLLADRIVDIESLSLEELYEDVDDENIDSITTGRTDACVNKGVVKGDINVGGIAGSMSIDDEDPEDSAAGTIEYEVGRRFITKCLVTDSVNEGYITAKKNGAGGICGYMNHGIIVDSEGYGSVESTEGDYVGGICGESLTIIKKCYALCSVNGNKNVGGIAGYAETLKNCYSMADVQSENGRAGAIAGQVAAYEEMDTNAGEEGAKVAGNYYVGENIHGIDNISYIGVAEPMNYSDLLTVEQLPTQFWHLKVIYKIEDTYLGSEEVRYGEKLDKLNFPQIPAKEGFYGAWPDVSEQRMGGTFVVEAAYKDNVTVVQSSGDAAGTDEGTWKRPYALVEDLFTEDTSLTASICDKTPPEEADGRQHVVYKVTLENGGIGETDSFALRLLNPYEKAVVYGCTGEAWTELESKSRGQYLQVDMTGTQEYFCIVEETTNKLLIIGGSAAAAAGLLMLAALRKRSARRKQPRAQKEKNEIKRK